MKKITYIIASALLMAPGLSPAMNLQLDSPISFEEFSLLSAAAQKQYEKDVREAYTEYEIDLNAKMEFAEQFPFWETLFPQADAGEATLCLIGGLRRTMVSQGGRMVCPTTGNGCGSYGNAGFQCGTMYNDACISRDPVNSISKRCSESAGDEPPSASRYNEKRTLIQSVAADCRSDKMDQRYQRQCSRFLERMNKTNNVAMTELTDVSSSARRDAALPKVRQGEGRVPGKNEAPEPAPAPSARVQSAPPQESAPPPASAKRESASGGDSDCMSRYRAKLGSLACVACGMEKAAPADIRNHGGGVSKWVSLLGIMAQTFYGPYNVGDEVSRKGFQQRVAEMVSSYGYCTDREYPMTPSSASRDWVDGRVSVRSGSQATAFSQTYGMGSTIKGIFTPIENSHAPMIYPEALFDDSDRIGGWDKGNAQNRQWKFRSMVKAHTAGFYASSFSKCATAADNRMANSKHFRMCPMRQGKWANGQDKQLYQAYLTNAELANNQQFYEAMASSCGITTPRKIPHKLCDNACWASRYVYRHGNSYMIRCDVANRETYNQYMSNLGKRGENSNGRDGKNGPEGEMGRNPYGQGHNGGDTNSGDGGGAAGGSSGAASGAAGGASGGESSSSR